MYEWNKCKGTEQRMQSKPHITRVIPETNLGRRIELVKPTVFVKSEVDLCNVDETSEH